MCLNGHFKKNGFTVQIVLLSIFLLTMCGAAYSAETYYTLQPDFDPVVEEKFGNTYQLIHYEIPQNKFRLFIPPGTTEITMVAFCAQDARIAVVTRLGQPPVCTYDTGKEYTLLDWPGAQGASLSGLASSDYQSRNFGGTIEILNSRASGYTGEWVYGQVIPYESGARIVKSRVTLWITVNDQYMAWYNNGMKTTPEISRSTSGSCSFEAGVPDSDGSGYTPPANTDPADGGGNTGFPTPSTPPGYTPPPPPEENAGDNNYTGGGKEEGDPPITDPEFSPPVTLKKGEWTVHECCVSDMGNRSKVILTPSITIQDVTESDVQYGCYAGILIGDDFYVAQKDIVGETVFTKYSKGPLPAYKFVKLENSTVVYDVFYSLMDRLNYSPSGLLESQVKFYLGFAPEGSELAMQDFRGVEIQIKP